jgi:hypothetical protein
VTKVPKAIYAEDQAISSLGNVQLHKRHSVMIEGGKIPRAKVMDQRIFDRYLMHGIFSAVQHAAAEQLLEQAGWAGLWARGVKWDGAGGGGQGCVVPFGVAPFGNSIALIRAEFSDRHAWLIVKMVVNDCDVAADESDATRVQRALDYLADSRGVTDPIRRLHQKAA